MELFRIGLLDHHRMEPLKQGGVLDWTCGLSSRGTLVLREKKITNVVSGKKKRSLIGRECGLF